MYKASHRMAYLKYTPPLNGILIGMYPENG
jgi:hypothetical protein